MATRLTEAQEAAACSIAQQVCSGQMTKPAGVAKLESEYGLKRTTASILINVYQALLAGREFRRTTSASAMRGFIESIQSNHGAAGLANALNALRLHILYFEDHYKTTMTSMRAVESVLRA